jgi:hypothetical protein
MVVKFITQLRQQWMGALALFLVLCGGTAWALEANSVKSRHIKNGQVKLADTNDKLRLKCPPGTRYHEGACIETTARDPLSQGQANLDCEDDGRRLPDVAELEGFRREPGITLLGNGEWTSAFFRDDLAFFGFLVPDNGVSGIESELAAKPYRCVAAPRR